MISKKIIILLILVIILVLYFSPKIYTAFLAFVGHTEMNATILSGITNITLGRLTYFSYPARIDIGCGNPSNINVTFNAIFENIGDLNITERIEIHVMDSSLNIINSYYDDFYNLAPLETRNFSANWAPTEGQYWVLVNVSYNSTLENKSIEEFHNIEMTVRQGIGTLRRFPGKISKIVPIGGTRIYPSGVQLWLEDACDNTTVILNKTQGIPGEWVSFSPNNLYLIPDIINSSNVTITIPPLTPEGVYENGTIFVYANDQRVDIGLSITTSYLDIILNATVQEKKVCQGKTVSAKINITKILPLPDLDVNMTYQILDFNNTIYDENKDYDVFLGNESFQKTSTLTVPSSAKEGYYMFFATLDYSSTLIQTYDIFEVISCISPSQPSQPSQGTISEVPISPKPSIRAISLNLSTDILTAIIGNKTNFIATVKNIGNESIDSIKLSIEGIPSEWFKILPTTANLKVDEVEKYFVLINIPNDARPGIYKLKVKATDSVESNIIILTLIIGKNQKEIADLLLKELETIRKQAKLSLTVEDCINTTTIKPLHQDAESAFERGMKYYDNNDYEGAVNWFEYALPLEKNVITKVDKTLELEIETTKSSKSISVIPPFYKPEEQIQLAGTYLQEKNYEKICDPILEIKRLIFIGIVFWPGLFILFIILIILILIFLRKLRKLEKVKTLERDKKRLETPNI